MKHVFLSIGFLLFGLVANIPAQSGGGENLLKAAKDFERDNRFDDALNQYDRLIKAPEASAEVRLEAKVRLGRIYFEVKLDVAKARPYFEEGAAAVRFPDLAAQSMVYLGRCFMVNARTEAQFTQALSEFDGVIRAYPNSPALVDALMEGGTVLELQHKFEDARIKYQSIVFGFPDSPAAPSAFMNLGRTLVRMDSIEDALKDYQNVQRLYGGQPFAAIAKENATLLYQLFILRSRTQAQVARKSDTFKLDDPDRMDWLPSGGVLITQSSRWLTVSTSGKVAAGAAAPASFTDPLGGSYRIAKKNSIILPDAKAITPFLRKDGKPEPFNEIVAVAANLQGDLVVASAGPEGLFRVDRQSGESAPFLPIVKKTQKILVDSEGNFYILDANSRSILIADWQGKTIATITAMSVGVKSLVDFTLDTFDDVYVLDQEGQFVILGGNTLNKTLRLKPIHKQDAVDRTANQPKPIKNLRAIAVSPAGTVYVVAKDQLLSFQ